VARDRGRPGGGRYDDMASRCRLDRKGRTPQADDAGDRTDPDEGQGNAGDERVPVVAGVVTG
jgi:hypothetical protein